MGITGKNKFTEKGTTVIPASYTMQTSNDIVKPVLRGQVNNFRMRPRIFNEHVETARQIQATVNASTIVGQIFKASQDNINGLGGITLGSAAGSLVDDFESYADSAALQAVWVGSNEPPILATVIAQDAKSMLLDLGGDVGDLYTKTIAATNYTGFTFSMSWYQTRGFNDAKVQFYIEDNVGNSKHLPLAVQDDDIWESFEFLETAMTEAQGTATDTTNIVKYGFELIDRRGGTDGYVDNILFTPGPGSVKLKLWDMGATLPVDGVTSIDDGTQYTELGDKGINGGTIVSEVSVSLIGGKRVYDVTRFVAGVALEIPGNTLLNIGNYYAITIHYVDTNVDVYGSNTSFNTNYYANGFAFTAPNEATAITKLGEYNDIAFTIFSTQDVFINTLVKFYDAEPGNQASESVYIEDKNMRIVGIIAGENKPQQFLEAEFKDRVFPMPKGSKFEVNYNSDFTDNVSTASILIGYIYEPPIING